MIIGGISLCVALWMTYCLSVNAHYECIAVCGTCRHRLKTEKNKEGHEREFCPGCRASGKRMAGWFYGYVPKGGNFAE